MSFGVGVGDCIVFLQALDRVGHLLAGGAIDGFQRYASTYQRFAQVAQHLNVFVATNASGSPHSILTNVLEDTERLLRSFFRKIKGLKKYLGKGRKRKSFWAALAKVRWPKYAAVLNELCQDIDRMLLLMNLVVTCQVRGSNLLDFEHALPFAHFVLEDARQAVFRPTFAEIPDWESLHQFLLRVYPVNDPGHAAIETWSYLLHNASREQDILPSSPCIKPLRDLISPDDRVQMSIIFQISELEAASLNEKCPACKTAWSDPSAVNVTCQQCRFWLSRRDSFDDTPDPLTQLALDTIQESGRRAFFDGILVEIQKNVLFDRPNGSQTSTEEAQRQGRSRSHRKSSGSTQTRSGAKTQPRRSTWRSFRRVTLCNPSWPSINDPDRQVAEMQLDSVMDGIEHTLRILREPHDAPFLWVSKAIGSRFANYRTDEHEMVLESAICQHKSRKQRTRLMTQQARLVSRYSQHAEESKARFHPAVVRARCFLWMISQMQRLEGQLLWACARLLLPWRSLENVTPGETPPLFKVFSIPHIPLLLLWRVTFDLAQDVIEAATLQKTPLVTLAVIFHLLRSADSLSIKYVLDGNLDWSDLEISSMPLFGRSAFSSPAAFGTWQAVCLDLLERTLASKGANILDDHDFRNVWAARRYLC